MLTPPEAYVPFFQTKGDKSEVLKDSIPLEVSHEAQSRLQGYDNQGKYLHTLIEIWNVPGIKNGSFHCFVLGVQWWIDHWSVN